VLPIRLAAAERQKSVGAKADIRQMKGRGLASPFEAAGERRRGGYLLWLFLGLAVARLGGLQPKPLPLALPVGAGFSNSEMRPGDAETAPFRRGPEQVLQDGELLYGPAQQGFDTAAFLAARPNLLFGDPAGEAAAIERAALQHSLSPKLLIALLALEGAGEPLGQRLGKMAMWLDDGYYGLLYRQEADMIFADGTRRRGPVAGGAAHFALARYLARGESEATWAARMLAFAETYDALFGPVSVLADPLPETLIQPPLLLPWNEGERWHYTGGPHGAWGVATAWGAVDFAPPSLVGCRAAPEWVIAAAPGRVAFSDEGLVLVDLDDDGFLGSGWVLAYLHMATEGRVAAGTWLEAGDRVGLPSCEGGVADGAHVHFARRYNGHWLPAAGGPAPLDLSGWTFLSLGDEYDGSMSHPSQGERMAVTSHRGGSSEVVGDNGPTRRAALAAAWTSLRGAGQALTDAAAADSVHSQALTTSEVDPSARFIDPSALSEDPNTLPIDPNTLPVGPNTLPVGPENRYPAPGSLMLRIALDGRENQATPILIALAGAPQGEIVLMGQTDAAGYSAPIVLPPGTAGRFDLRLRAPGFAPMYALAVDLGPDGSFLDLSAGGRIRMRPGELNSDDRIDARDLAAWLGHWRAGRSLADLDGDGRAGASDLLRVMRGAGGG
jgi:murein DD-endopeptidase MepM/ murein hydrolase activator NlpD